jgi:predicted permease
MRLIDKLRNAWRAVFHTSQVQRDLEDELRFAEEELTSRYLSRGLSADAAARAVRVELGRVDTMKEDVQARGLAHRIEALKRDWVSAWRGLARTPGFSLVVVVVLAGGIGAATAIFSVVNALLLTPLPYRDADRLVFVWQDLTAAGYPRAPLAGPELQDLRDRSKLFTGFGAVWANTVALTDGDEPEQLRIGLVTPDFFDVLGADPFLGRTFKPGDDGQDGSTSILLSYELWRRRYGGNRDLVGQRVLVNGRPTTVLGVMPESFRMLLPADSAIPDDQQAWLLLSRTAVRWPRTQQFARVVGRLAPGVPLSEGQREIQSIAQQVGKEFTNYGKDGLTLYGVGLQADATREVRPALFALFAAVCLLLTIGCVNVAGLLVTRAAARHHETTVRLAIGASQGRLFRQYLAEGLLLSLAGGVAGVLMARGMLAFLIAVRPATLSRMDATALDLRVLAFAVAVSVLWGVLFSLAPFAQVFRTNISRLLHGGGRGAVSSNGRLRGGLVVTQIAISCVLLITAGLLARGFYDLQRQRAGFEDEGVLTFKLSLSGTKFRSPDQVATFSRLLREQLAALPGVSHSGAISHLPYDTVPNWGTPYVPEVVTDTAQEGLADARAVTPGYFEAVGAELVEGRWFSEDDTAKSIPVAIVDDLLVRKMWPGESAIGKRLKADPGTTGSPRVPVTIVGVVRHLRHREVTRDLREQMYFPSQQSYRNPMAYAIKTAGVPADLAPAVRRAMLDIDRTLPIYDVRPLTTYTGAARATQRFTLVLALAFAGSALALAIVGIYGVTAFTAAQRRREFGVRMALGARGGQVAALAMSSTLRMAGIGAVAGCLGAAGLSRLIRSQMSTVSIADPLAYAGGVTVMLLATVLASALPAWRVARANPVESLWE